MSSNEKARIDAINRARRSDGKFGNWELDSSEVELEDSIVDTSIDDDVNQLSDGSGAEDRATPQRFATKDEAADQLIRQPLGPYVYDRDVDAIAKEVLGEYEDGYALKVSEEDFWKFVIKYANDRCDLKDGIPQGDSFNYILIEGHAHKEQRRVECRALLTKVMDLRAKGENPISPEGIYDINEAGGDVELLAYWDAYETAIELPEGAQPLSLYVRYKEALGEEMYEVNPEAVDALYGKGEMPQDIRGEKHTFGRFTMEDEILGGGNYVGMSPERIAYEEDKDRKLFGTYWWDLWNFNNYPTLKRGPAHPQPRAEAG